MSRKNKYKRQFRLYDIYRLATTHEMSFIEGIESYEVNRDASVIRIKYTSHPITHRYTAKNEEELKEVVRLVNQMLGNCHKPGPMRRRK